MSHAHDAGDAKRLRFAVITVSDTRTLETDEGGAIVEAMVREAGQEVVAREIVKDERAAIRSAIEAQRATADVIVTTGGTGIAPRDVTYEVVAELLDKTLDGFGEAFRRLSWDEVGARSILSRAIAGTFGRAVIFTLPGSTKAVRLAMREIVLPVAKHAVGLLR
jgi:molybdenum cofactor biosynthesis protein B